MTALDKKNVSLEESLSSVEPLDSGSQLPAEPNPGTSNALAPKPAWNNQGSHHDGKDLSSHKGSFFSKKFKNKITDSPPRTANSPLLRTDGQKQTAQKKDAKHVPKIKVEPPSDKSIDKHPKISWKSKLSFHGTKSGNDVDKAASESSVKKQNEENSKEAVGKEVEKTSTKSLLGKLIQKASSSKSSLRSSGAQSPAEGATSGQTHDSKNHLVVPPVKPFNPEEASPPEHSKRRESRRESMSEEHRNMDEAFEERTDKREPVRLLNRRKSRGPVEAPLAEYEICVQDYVSLDRDSTMQMAPTSYSVQMMPTSPKTSPGPHSSSYPTTDSHKHKGRKTIISVKSKESSKIRTKAGCFSWMR